MDNDRNTIAMKLASKDKYIPFVFYHNPLIKNK